MIQDYSFTKHRIFQWLGIILSLGIIAVGYWYFQAQAGLKTNTGASQPQGTGRLDSGLAGYWRMDDGSGSSATDSSVNGNTGTLNNMESGDWITGQIGNGLDFDGSNENISIPDANSLDITGKLTISAWINSDTYPASGQYASMIVKGNVGTPAVNYGLETYGSSSSQQMAFFFYNGGNHIIRGGTNLATGTWHHLTVVYDDTANDIRLYVNGVQETETVITGSPETSSIVANSIQAEIGSYNSDRHYFDGKLDEVRIYNRTLSPDEVAQLYRLTSPTGVDTSLMAYWSFNDQDMNGTTAYDRSGRPGNSGTANGNTTKIEGKLGQALSFNGSSSVVNISVPSGSLSTPTYATFSAWINTSGDPGHAQYILRERNASSYSLYLAQTTRNLVFANISGTRDSGYAIPANTWALVTLTVNNGTGTFYVNGVQVNQQSFSISGNGSAYVTLGSYDDGPQFVFNGKLDEIRIYSRALSAAEIKALYALGQSDQVNSSVSQPQGVGRLDSGMAGYWPLDEGTGTTTADGSVNGNNGTFSSAPSWTTGQIGNALDFDGVDDYVSVTDPASGVLDFNVPGNGVYGRVFSIAGWFNRDTFTTDDTIIAKKNDQGNTTAGYIVYIDDADDKLYVVVCGAACAGATSPVTAVSTTTYTATGWHHFVITVDQYRNTGGGDSRCPSIWVDGTPVTTNSCAEYLHYTGNLANSLALTIGAESDGGNPFDGKLDDIRIYNRPVSPGYIRDLYQNTSTTVASESSLKGYWGFEGGVITGTVTHDISGFGNDGTLTNGPAITEGKLGQALDLDGTDDYVSIADNSALDVGDTEDLTLTGWFYRDTFTTDDTIVAKRNGIANTDDGYILYVDDSTDKLTFEVSENSGTDEYQLESIATFTTAGWYHYAIVWDQDSATNSEIYIDGVANTATDTGTIGNLGDLGNALVLAIGAESDAGSPFDGKLDETRLYKRALTAAEIKGLYDVGASDKVNSSVSQPQGTGRLDSGLAGYWPLDEGSGTSAADMSTNGNNATVPNSWTTGQVGSAVSFNGSTTMSASAYVIDNKQDVTLAAWVYPRSTGGYRAWFYKGVAGCDEGTAKYMFENNAGSFLTFFMGGSNLTSSTILSTNQWQHIVATNSAAGSAIYVNGVLVKSGSALPTPATSSETWYFNRCNSIDANMDEIRIYNRALSADEIGQLYRLTSPTGVDTSLKGYWSFNGKDLSGTTAYDRSGAGNNGTLTNGPAITEGKLGQGLSFDGSNDYVTIPDANSLDITGAITLSTWVKTTDSTDSCFIAKSANGSNVCFGLASAKVYEIGILSGTIYFQISDSFTASFASGSASSITDNRWHLVTATWDGTTGTNGLKIYFDGILTYQATSTISNIVSASSALSLSAQSSSAYTGTMDEVRVYNRALGTSEITALYNQGR